MKITIEVPESIIADTLVSACEDSGYWARTSSYPYEAPKGWGVPLKLRLPIKVYDLEENAEYCLDENALQRGIQLMAEKYPKHFADMIGENGDAITGDVLLQLATIGELKYG